jgi:CysZ protein
LGIALLTLIVSFIPVVNLLAPVIAGLWAAWSLALQYQDYPADSDQMSFAALRQHLGANRWQSLSFGFSALLASSVPFVNLFLLPATVVGGTLLWCQQRQGVER